MRKILFAISFLFLFTTVSVQADTSAQQAFSTEQKEAFIQGSITVKGEGTGPSERSISAGQRRIMALRAAKIMALREAAEILDGVTVSGETSVKDASAESDVIYTTVQSVIRGAHVVKEDYDPVSAIASVYLSVPLTGPNGLLGKMLPGVSSLVTAPGAPYYQPPLNGGTVVYDGLIIDCRNYPFKPALINRVLAENGDLLYDPSRLDAETLNETGGARYTDDIEKAKEILGDLGSANPVVLEASGVLRGTDATVSPADAVRIFSSSQQSDFLARARVVFVLK